MSMEKCYSADRYRGTRYPWCTAMGPCDACMEKWISLLPGKVCPLDGDPIDPRSRAMFCTKHRKQWECYICRICGENSHLTHRDKYYCGSCLDGDPILSQEYEYDAREFVKAHPEIFHKSDNQADGAL